MLSSIMTGLSPDGYAFDPLELEPFGISDGTVCDAALIRGGAKGSKYELTAYEHRYEHQAPHLMISPVPFADWASAFNVRLVLPGSLKKANNPNVSRRLDPTYGALHALASCGVNLVRDRSAQIGFDMIVFDAICTLPHLAGRIAEIVARCDDTLAKDYSRMRGRNEYSPDDSPRKRALQEIGRVMLPALYELECRLMALGAARQMFHSDARYSTDELRQLSKVESSLYYQPAFSTDDRIVAEVAREDSLYGAPRFLNPKAMQSGTDPYYLDYTEFMRLAKVHPLNRGERGLGPGGSDTPDVAKKRLINAAEYKADNKLCLSAFYAGDAGASRHAAMFFARQCFPAVVVRAMPTLAHARLHVVPLDNVTTFPMTFANGCLACQGPVGIRGQTESTEPGQYLVDALQKACTHLSGKRPDPSFSTRDHAIAHFDIDDRSIRIRPIRRKVARQEACRVTVRYTITTTVAKQDPRVDEVVPDITGVLNAIVALCAKARFKVEWVRHRMIKARVSRTDPEQEFNEKSDTWSPKFEGQVRLVLRLLPDARRLHIPKIETRNHKLREHLKGQIDEFIRVVKHKELAMEKNDLSDAWAPFADVLSARDLFLHGGLADQLRSEVAKLEVNIAPKLDKKPTRIENVVIACQLVNADDVSKGLVREIPDRSGRY